MVVFQRTAMHAGGHMRLATCLCMAIESSEDPFTPRLCPR